MRCGMSETPMCNSCSSLVGSPLDPYSGGPPTMGFLCQFCPWAPQALKQMCKLPKVRASSNSLCSLPTEVRDSAIWKGLLQAAFWRNFSVAILILPTLLHASLSSFAGFSSARLLLSLHPGSTSSSPPLLLEMHTFLHFFKPSPKTLKPR